MKILSLIFDWSEVWALFIPIATFLKKKKQPAYLLPIIVYVFLALFINLFADIIADFKKDLNFSDYFQTNTFLYNVHSIVRFACFSTFFILVDRRAVTSLKKAIQIIFTVFTITYFSFENFNNPNHISADFLSAEAFLLLVYCLIYYFFRLKEETEKLFLSKGFYIVTGLSIFVVINFFVFLFYIPMIASDTNLANQMWSIHNIAYIILCISIAKAFYTPDAT